MVSVLFKNKRKGAVQVIIFIIVIVYHEFLNLFGSL